MRFHVFASHLSARLCAKILVVIMASVLLVGISLTTFWQPASHAKANSAPLVGAIRWDAWFPDVSTFSGYVDPSIYSTYNYRQPFYGWNEVDSGHDQAIMDQEIRYAAANHLDYWAFDWYPEGLGYTQGNLGRALDYYLASSLKSAMKFSFVIQSSWAYTGAGIPNPQVITDHWQSTFVPYFVNMFKDPQYVKVNGNHPLVYWFGATSMPANELQLLTQATTNAGLGAPYYVAMEGAGAAQSAGMQGQTEYNAELGRSAQCYSTQASADTNLDGQGAANGITTAPFLQAVGDARPRTSWEDPNGYFMDQPTYNQWQSHVQSQYNWAVNNPTETSDPATLLIYAWDEIDEGGPGIVPTGQEGLKYLAGVNAVKTGTSPAFYYDTLNDDNCNVAYSGSWVSNKVIGNYNNDEHVSSTANDSMVLTWSGTGFDVVGSKGPDRGKMQVFIDNQSQGTFDLYNATQQQQQILFSKLNAASGSHTLKIVVTGQKNSSSSGTTVGIDAIRVKAINSGPTATPPPAPTGLQSSATLGAVSLTWAPTSDTTSYTIKRSTDGVNFTTLSSNQTGTSYNDTAVTNETLYYYVVDANNANGTSVDSVVMLAQPSTVVKQWQFDMENNPQWSDAYEDSGTTANGTLNLTSTGTDPQILSDDNLSINTANVKCLSVRMKNQTADTVGQFFFTTTASPNLDGTKSYTFATQPNSDYTTYMVDATTNSSWTGTLKQLRFDPGQSSGTYNIAGIILSALPCNPVATTAFATGVTNRGSLRSDYAGDVGLRFTTGSAPVTITDLGRYFSTGNSREHTLKIVRVSDKADIATTTLNMNVGTPDAAGFVYAPLAAPVTLAANTAYYLVSSETVGGDQWYDNASTTVNTTSVAGITGSVYANGASWVENGSAGNSYGPLSFHYATATASTSFATAVTTGSQIRNNFSSNQGMSITTGNTSITVKSLGRYFTAGNSGTHTLEIVRASDSAVLGSATVNMSVGTADSLGFKYATLSTPVTLAANTTYYIVSQETSGGDQWYGNTTLPALTTTGIATINAGVYFYNNTWNSYGGAGNCYDPLNFTY